MASTATLTDLPLDALMRILCCLNSPKDILSCRLASKCFEPVWNTHHVWRALLARRFDMHIKGPRAGKNEHSRNLDWPKLYAHVRMAPGRCPLRSVRFRGVWTDGDVDEPVERHWVDNAFSLNRWQVFGSDREPNIHAIGLLTDEWYPENLLSKEEQEQHRAVLLQRLRAPVQATPELHEAFWGGQNELPDADVEYEPMPDLEDLTLWELQQLLNHLRVFLEMAYEVGEMLLQDEGGNQISQSELGELSRALMQSQRAQHAKRQCIKARRSNERHKLDVQGIRYLWPFVADPDNPGSVANSPHRVAVIQRLMVRRPETNWTCPVASGVVFLADFRYQFGMRMESIPNDDVEVTEEGDPRGPPGTPISLLEQHKVHEFVFQGFQEMVEEEVCAAFNGVASRSDLARLEPLARAGVVPRPIRGGCSPLGAWLEFDPDWHPPRGCSVRPVAWFQFEARQVLPADTPTAGGSPVDFPPGASYADIPWNLPGVCTPFDMEDGVVDTSYGEEYDTSANPGVEDSQMQSIRCVELPLRRMHAGSCAVIKLISCENRMERDDPHDHANIDVAAVGFLGRDVTLPLHVFSLPPSSNEASDPTK